MEKAILLSVLMLSCQVCTAVTVTATDNYDGTCLIELNTVAGEEDIIGIALDVDCLVGGIVDIDITSYNPLMNIYPDALNDLLDDPYGYGSGDPLAGGGITPADPPFPSSSFSFSAAVLNGDNPSGIDGYSTVRFLLSANENVSGIIQENSTRGGLVSVDGTSLDFHPEQLDFTITIPEPATLSLLALGAFLAGRRRRT